MKQRRPHHPCTACIGPALYRYNSIACVPQRSQQRDMHNSALVACGLFSYQSACGRIDTSKDESKSSHSSHFSRVLRDNISRNFYQSRNRNYLLYPTCICLCLYLLLLYALINVTPVSPVTEDGLFCCHAHALSLLTLGVGVSLVLCDGSCPASTACCGYRSRTGDHFYHRASLVATFVRLLFC